MSAKKNQPADRMIALIVAPSGAGKTLFGVNIGDAIHYDSDIGGGATYAKARIKANGSDLVTVNNYPELLADLRRRTAQGKLKKNIIIDHVTSLHQEAVLRHNPEMLDDFGRSGNKATAEWRKIREFAKTFDCNLYAFAHVKGKWKDQKLVGETADGAKNIEGDVSVVLHVYPQEDQNGNQIFPSIAKVKKWRRLPDDPRGAVPPQFPFEVDKFIEIAGDDVTRKQEKVDVATAEQVNEIVELLDKVKIDPALLNKWHTKAGTETWGEMTKDTLQACIDYIKKQIPGGEK